MRATEFVAAILLALAAGCAAAPADTEGAAPSVTPAPVLLHHVYFDLLEDDEAACASFAGQCRASLGGLGDIRSMTIATRAAELDRDVNDATYDVALVLTFVDRAAHDRYQVSSEHEQLIQALAPKIARVRVFDAWTVE